MADSLLALYDLLASLTEPEWAALSPLLAPHRPYLPPDGRPPAERAAAVVQVVEQRGLERAVLEARIREIRGRRPPSELLVAVVAVRALTSPARPGRSSPPGRPRRSCRVAPGAATGRASRPRSRPSRSRSRRRRIGSPPRPPPRELLHSPIASPSPVE